MTAKLRRLYRELSRRKVIRVALYYAGAGAAWIGVVVDGGPELGLSEPVISVLVWGAVVGFPIALALAWFLKLGREESAPWKPEALDDPEPGPQDQPLHAPAPAAHGITPPAKGIQVQTLGGIRVFQDGKEITALPRKPVRCALLAYIAVERNPPKEKALALLWPDKDPELARKSLNQTLTELRKDLGDDWVDSSGPFLIIRDDIQTDLAGFQQATREARWEEALKCHGGEFLDGFYLSGSYGFEEWQSQVAGRVKLTQRKAHTRLIEAKHRDGDIPGALGLARSWAEQSPLDDGAQNWYMRLLAEAGQRGAALRHAQTFLHRLQQDEEEPLGETLELIELIKKGEVGNGQGVKTPHTAAPVVEPPLPPPTPMLARVGRWLRRRYPPLLLGAALVASIWFIIRPSQGDPNKIVCFPPDILGTFAVQAQDVCTAISFAIEQVPNLEFEDARPYLTEYERENPAAIGLAKASRISRRLDAGYFILPSLTAELDSLFVTLSLYESRTARLAQNGRGSGSVQSASSGQIAGRSMLAIFPTLISIGPSPDLDFLIDPDPAAVGLMLQGQRYYRDLQFDSAYLLMREAVARDTLLALAALRGAQAASWAHLLEKADSLARLAARHATLLPPHQANLAKGLNAFYQGQADSALYFYRAALDWNPGSSEAWIAKGEVFYHLLPPGIRIPDSARAAFEKAVEIDPGFSTPRLHLAQIALNLGDTEEAERHIGELAPTSVDPSTMLGLTTAVECLRGAIAQDAWDDLAISDLEAAYLAASDLAPGGRAPKCAEDGFRALLRASHRPGGSLYEWGSILGLSGILLAQGRADEASTLLDSLQAAGTRGVQFLPLTAATLYPQFEALAWQTDSLGRRYFGDEFQHPRPGEGWSLGSFHASQENIVDLERLTRGLDSISVDNPESLKDATYARALRGHVLLTRGDTAGAIEAFGGLNPDWRYDQVTVDARQVMPFERLLLARLLLSTGKYREALVAAEIFDHPAPLIFLYFLPQSLQIRYQAAEALGWHGEAEEYQRRLSLLAGPPPVDQTISPSGDGR